MGPVARRSKGRKAKSYDDGANKSLSEIKKVKKTTQTSVIHGVSLLTEVDIYLFKEGRHFSLYKKLGAHLMEVNGVYGTYFAVWAPNAKEVSVIGNFNGWNPAEHPLATRWDSSGIWEGFIPQVGHGDVYKYCIVSREHDQVLEKCDPFAFHTEVPPCTASIVWDAKYDWKDAQWKKSRQEKNGLDKPISIYELHLGSWQRKVEEENRCLSYQEVAQPLIAYIKEMGYTHVEFMPLKAYPFCGSWGYQTTGYFAPASKYGDPQDLKYLIDQLHQNDIGVYLDWVPSHFPGDEHALINFDGTALFEHVDPRKGYHPDWTSYIFNYGRNEVKNFLISSALFWLDYYHVDGLRVDGVASMLYLDYSREDGEWIPNDEGGRENKEAIQFLKELNAEAYRQYPDIQMIAEESTAWPGVSRPTEQGGLGFGMKWNMGWMHDTLEYFKKEPIHRSHHQNDLTFSMLYCYDENFTLSLSHDEVVHGKASLLSKMAGDDWQKFANLRLLFGYMFAHPGKKLMFMGGEFGQWDEWNYQKSLDWHLLQYAPHQGLQKLVKDLNHLYRKQPALYEDDFTPNGFEWIDSSDAATSVLTFVRKGKNREDDMVAVCNFTPVVRHNYRVGVPAAGYWKEVLNSDAEIYGGSNVGNEGGVVTDAIEWNGRPQSVALTLPPLSVCYFRRD